MLNSSATVQPITKGNVTLYSSEAPFKVLSSHIELRVYWICAWNKHVSCIRKNKKLHSISSVLYEWYKCWLKKSEISIIIKTVWHQNDKLNEKTTQWNMLMIIIYYTNIKGKLHPNQIWACFVRCLKIINTFFGNIICILKQIVWETKKMTLQFH